MLLTLFLMINVVHIDGVVVVVVVAGEAAIGGGGGGVAVEHDKRRSYDTYV